MLCELSKFKEKVFEKVIIFTIFDQFLEHNSSNSIVYLDMFWSFGRNILLGYFVLTKLPVY